MRKGLFALVLALLTVGAVYAQDAATDFENVDPTGQTISFWHQHTQEREAELDKIVADFNANNEYGITVNAEFQGGYGDIFQKMLPLLGTSDAPNLVVAYQNQAATYEVQDGVVDMDPLVNSAKWGLDDATKADFFPGFYNADVFPSFGNQRLGFPPNRSAEVMYYNASWLQELRDAGSISFDGPPSTPEQFREAACAASQNGFSGAADDTSIGYEISIDASRFASWTFAFGGDMFDYEANQYTLDSPAAVEAMTFLQDLVEEGCATIVTEQYGDQTDFGAGRTLFAVGSSSGLPFYRSAVEEGGAFDWSVAALPHTTENPVINVYGASVSIPSGHTPEEDLAAWVFLKYYTSPEVQADWARASNYFPVRESVAANLGDYFAADPAYETAFDLLEYSKAEPPVPGYDFVRDRIREDMASIIDGADVAETLAAANEEANIILEDQLAEMN